MKKKQITIRSGIFVGLLLLLLFPLVIPVPAEVSTKTIVGFSGSEDSMNEYSTIRSSEVKTPSKTKIKDPTGKTQGYLLDDYSEDIFELTGSRGQTSRHFYDKTIGKYTYQSDSLVQKEGVLDETVWVTTEEYPYRFVLRLRNGEIFFFETASEISDLLNTIDRTTIWAVGFESFAGIMGFYLNFQDTLHGHGQYLYWPRLSSGKISGYNMPLYALYPHLYAKNDGEWFDQILNDRSLYFGATQNPRNTLEFFSTDDEFGVFFSLSEVDIQGTTWNFKHGFKYRIDDQLYHMITEFECVDHVFDDIGLAYEITTSPQSDNTPYKPSYFVLHNEMESVAVSVQEAWQAGQYLEDFYSEVNIISENKEKFRFTFDDMELAGFTEKYLELREQEMPDGSVRKVLCAGMYGYGEYSAGTWIEIDPTFYCKDDDWDLYQDIDSEFFQINDEYLRLGHYYRDMPWPDPDIDLSYRAWCAFDTDIKVAIEEITSITFKLYVDYEAMESGEGASVYVYNIGGNFNNNSCKENDTSWALGTNSYESGVFDLSSTGWRTGDSAKMSNLLDDWNTSRNYDEDMISIHLVNYLTDSGTVDYACVADSQQEVHFPKLSFSYVPYHQVDIRNLGSGEQNDKLRQGVTIDIIAQVIGPGVTSVKYQIDSETEQNMTQFGSTNLYIGSWEINQSLGNHTVKVMAYTELLYYCNDSVTVEVVSGYIADLFYEVDYLESPCPQPSEDVFDYWQNYWDTRAINVTYVFDDEVNQTGVGWDANNGLNSAEYWVIENAYNNYQFETEGTDDDRAYGDFDYGVFDSQEKWILWGNNFTFLGGFLYGLCHLNGAWISDREDQNDPPVYEVYNGNYIFVSAEISEDYETTHNITDEGVKVQVLMHEIGHSIGIIKHFYNWSDKSILWIESEHFDPDSYSLMASIQENGACTLTNHWYYSREYWDIRNFEYY